MEQDFKLELNAEEQAYLLRLVGLAIARALNGKLDEDWIPQPPGELLEKELGAFVTLNKNGRLRGCIGRIAGEGPLYLTVARMAVAAAFNDPRFPRLRPEEFEELEYEVSVLGPILPCREPEKIITGRHGLIMKQGRRQGLLLPQVPLEWGWKREEFLRQTCNKAGLPPEQWREAWKPGSDTELYWFEAVIYK